MAITNGIGAITGILSPYIVSDVLLLDFFIQINFKKLIHNFFYSQVGVMTPNVSVSFDDMYVEKLLLHSFCISGVVAFLVYF